MRATLFRWTMLFVVLMTARFVSAADEKQEPMSIDALPPSVVQTMPAAGDSHVDPSLKEIRVTFSKDMKTDKMWSWVQVSKESFPETAGDVHYLADKRTCVLPVKLKPDHTYVLWINRGKFNSFRDEGNRPAVPYLLVFKTIKADAADAAKASATEAAQAWLVLTDAGKHDDAYAASAALFRKAITAKQWSQAIAAGRAPLGRLTERKLIDATYATQLPGAPRGQYVVLQFEAQSEKSGRVVETITPMLDDDGTWRVSGYFVKVAPQQ